MKTVNVEDYVWEELSRIKIETQVDRLSDVIADLLSQRKEKKK